MDLPPALLAQLPEPDRHGLRLVLCPTWITLPEGSQCRLLVTPFDQESPNLSDDLLSRVSLVLPSDGQAYLAPHLRYDSKLMVLGEQLSYSWGNSLTVDGKNWKHKQVLYKGGTWVLSLREAETALLGEVAKLWAVLESRAAQLNSEGVDYYIMHKSGLADGKGVSQ